MPTQDLEQHFLRRDLRDTVNKNRVVLDALQTTVDVVDAKLGASGTDTITAGNTSVQVTHNFGSTAYVASVVPTSDLGLSRRYWIANKSVNTFDITIDATIGTNKSFMWVVRGT
jgi:hypothetical protein